METHYIYTINILGNNGTESPCYVGCTSNMERRKKEHRCSSNLKHDYKASPQLFETLNKHQWNIKVVGEAPNKELGEAMESELISMYLIIGYPLFNKREMELKNCTITATDGTKYDGVTATPHRRNEAVTLLNAIRKPIQEELF